MRHVKHLENAAFVSSQVRTRMWARCRAQERERTLVVCVCLCVYVCVIVWEGASVCASCARRDTHSSARLIGLPWSSTSARADAPCGRRRPQACADHPHSWAAAAMPMVNVAHTAQRDIITHSTTQCQQPSTPLESKVKSQETTKRARQ